MIHKYYKKNVNNFEYNDMIFCFQVDMDMGIWIVNIIYKNNDRYPNFLDC